MILQDKINKEKENKDKITNNQDIDKKDTQEEVKDDQMISLENSPNSINLNDELLNNANILNADNNVIQQFNSTDALTIAQQNNEEPADVTNTYIELSQNNSG